ncbi:tabserin-like [Styela clava]
MAYFTHFRLPNDTTCKLRGISDLGMNVDDYVVPSTNLPWIVTIEQHGRRKCGGIAIDSNKILTTAHCFIRNPRQSNHKPTPRPCKMLENYDVRSSNGKKYNIKNVKWHKNYHRERGNADFYRFDIAVVELESPLSCGFTRCLKTSYPVPTKSHVCWAIDETKSGLPTSDQTQLHLTKIVVTPCREGHRPHHRKFHLCTNKTMAEGQSGQPILCTDMKTGHYSISALISQRNPRGTATVLTNLYHDVFPDKWASCNSTIGKFPISPS